MDKWNKPKCLFVFGTSVEWWIILMTGATSGAETAYPSEAPEFTPGF